MLDTVVGRAFNLTFMLMTESLPLDNAEDVAVSSSMIVVAIVVGVEVNGDADDLSLSSTVEGEGGHHSPSGPSSMIDAVRAMSRERGKSRPEGKTTDGAVPTARQSMIASDSSLVSVPFSVSNFTTVIWPDKESCNARWCWCQYNKKVKCTRITFVSTCIAFAVIAAVMTEVEGYIQKYIALR